MEFMIVSLSHDRIKLLKLQPNNIRSLVVPKCAEGLEYCLGLVGYCTRFISIYKDKGELLILARKMNIFRNHKQETAFIQLKNGLTKSARLKSFLQMMMVFIKADASKYAVPHPLQKDRSGFMSIKERI